MTEERDLDKAHAELHYGKYSAGYNRGLARGREGNLALIQEREVYRTFLRELQELNDQCDGDILPSEFADRLRRLVEGKG